MLSMLMYMMYMMLKGYECNNEYVEKETMCMVWTAVGQSSELSRLV